MSRLLRESKKQYMFNLISNENNRHSLDETLSIYQRLLKDVISLEQDPEKHAGSRKEKQP